MPKPQEVATIIANGQVYSTWDTIEIWRECTQPVSFMKFRCVELSSQRGWENLALIPGQEASGYLGGQLAITGNVMSRQVVYDKGSHAVEIIVAGLTQQMTASTVKGEPGQYMKQTLRQIMSAVAQEVGVSAFIQGSPAGADIPFERVQEHLGETRHQFIERLARWRNLHVRDDEKGNYILFRGESSGGGAAFVEGKNILKARLLMNYEYAVDRITVLTQQHGNDLHWGNTASAVMATSDNSEYKGKPRPMKLLGEQTGNKQEAQMRADHEMNLNALDICEAQITVQGWFTDEGGLWMYLADGKHTATIQSRMLMPVDSFTLYIKGARHMQDSENGTTTEVSLCLLKGLGTDRIGPDSFPGMT